MENIVIQNNPHKVEHIDTNNAWGFGGKAGTLTHFSDGFSIFKGRNHHRHTGTSNADAIYFKDHEIIGEKSNTIYWYDVEITGEKVYHVNYACFKEWEFTDPNITKVTLSKIISIPFKF